MTSSLNDQNTYEKLSKDPTPKYTKRKLVDILKRLKTEDKIEESQYCLLYPTAENTPRLYCTTKIHKEGNPIRPIVDYTGSFVWSLSDDVTFYFDHVYDPLLKPTLNPRNENNTKTRGKSSGPDHL